ncbi:hypothetical protein HZC31_01790 [Candidatus Woesearchaeota archaeon]|nr:hypothetical protein [Candidatus Woesearchaeota archaeon]
MKILYFFLFLALLPTVAAFDCSSVSNPAACEEILSLELNETQEEYLLADLVYPYNYPNYDFIADYNRAIQVTTPPENTTIYSSTSFKNAWMSFLTLFPAIYEEDVLYVPSQTNTLSAYHYDLEIPKTTAVVDCQTKYSVLQNQSTVSILVNGKKQAEGTDANVSITEDSIITTQLDILFSLGVEHWKQKKYCCSYKKGKCKTWCTSCQYDSTEKKQDSLTISESKEVAYYDDIPFADLLIVNQYYNTTKGNLTAVNYTFLNLSFENAYFTEQNKMYSVVFEKKPYYFITLKSENITDRKSFNINRDNNTFFVQNPNNCTLFASNYFYNYSSLCDLTVQQEIVPEFEIIERNSNLILLVQIILLLIVFYVLMKEIKKRLFIFFLVLVIIIPFVAAEEEECGITNLSSCLPEAMYDYFLEIINAPLQPLLLSIKSLLTADVETDIFYEPWLAVTYVLSFFYVFLFLYAGFTFLTSGGNPIRRAHAKESLQNTVLMIILIAASYYLYDLLLTVNSSISNGILDMIDEEFFLLTFDNFVNIALEGIFVTFYLFALLFALLFLVLRYIVVSFGVILFPIGIFCYFIPPLRSYGRFILNVLAIFIFISIIDLLLILVCSLIVENAIFENITIVVMIACFSLINYSLFWAIKFAMTKSSMDGLKDDVQQAVKYIAAVV